MVAQMSVCAESWVARPPVGAVGMAMVIALLAAASGGCAARGDAAAREIASLRERVGELEAARQRDNKRLEVLTTRIVALESSPASTPQKRRPALPVVRVRPKQASTSERARPRSRRILVESPHETGDLRDEPIIAAGDETLDEEDDGERPLLKLWETPGVSGGGSSRPAAGGARRRSIKLASVSERLPVVPIPNMPGTPELTATPAALSMGQREGQGGSEPTPSAAAVSETIDRAREQMRSGDCGSALRDLSRLLTQSPEHPSAPQAMLLRAMCLRRTGAPLRAIGELERMGRRYPSSARRSTALLEMAESYVALGDVDRARELFGHVMRRFPRSRAASRATARVQELGRGGRAREER